jgi:alkanesulfonate monooxygenase SsuD/methylene tetrahydromethanopterin reductase-like flavin-dependent oxidoreductase (luciferase family)
MGREMKIGIGLPSTIPGIPGRLILDWARAAEQAGFSTLATLDRLVYANLETVPTLAAAAAVTERIGLTTAVMIGPYRGNGALLAKQLATVDVISAGPIGPTPLHAGGPPLLIGGGSPAAFRRMGEYGAGWILGAGGPDAFAAAVPKVRESWQAAGREGEPRLVAIGYVSLGDDAAEHAQRYLGNYYAFAGDYVDRIVSGARTTDEQVADTVAGFTEAGCDELILFPCNPALHQIDLIANVTGPH